MKIDIRTIIVSSQLKDCNTYMISIRSMRNILQLKRTGNKTDIRTIVVCSQLKLQYIYMISIRWMKHDAYPQARM